MLKTDLRAALLNDFEGTRGLIYRRLLEVGYAIKPHLLNDLCEALISETPLLVEGPPGVGKTVLAKSLVRAFELPFVRVQCDAIDYETIIGRWENELQNQFVKQATDSGELTFEEARRRQWTREFFTVGSALSAYSNSTPKSSPFIPLLLLDEIDKLSKEDSNIFLELLEEHGRTVGNLGFVGLQAERHVPLVILTSNGEVTGPLASRCLYTYVEPLSVEEEIFVLKVQVPGVKEELLAQVVKLAQYLREDKGFMLSPPETRETVRFLKALVAKGCTSLSYQVIERHLCYLAQRKLDRKQLMDPLLKPIQRLLSVAKNPHFKIKDVLVDAAISKALKHYEIEEERNVRAVDQRA